MNSKDHTTLVAAVKAAGLVDTLKGKGPFTVFAPTNAAFDKLPAGTVDTLVKPENKAKLTKILTYHVVPGTLLSSKLAADITAAKGNSTATLKTVEGGTLTLSKVGDDQAVPALATLMRKKNFLARKKTRTLKEQSLAALRAIRTPAATRAIDEAAKTGDRLLRRLAQAGS